MTNFVDGNVSLPANKLDSSGSSDPVLNPTRRWSANDANRVFSALTDIRTVLQRNAVNAKAFGAVGDGAANDGPAIQAAIDAAAATASGAFGGFVKLPKGVYLINQQLVLKSGVGLVGDGPSSTTIKAKSTFNAASMIANQSQDGTQEYAFLESLTVEAGGATCTEAAVSWGSLFINSYIRDVVILDSSSVGLHVFAGGTPGGMGPVLIENVWVAHSTSHNVLIEEVAGNAGAASGILCVNLTSEHQGSNASALYLRGLGKCEGWQFVNTHIEQGGSQTGRTCITLDGVSDVRFIGVQLQAGTPANETAGITITNVAQNVRYRFDGVTNINTINPVINDLKQGMTVGAVNVACYVSPDYVTVGGARFQPAGSSAIGLAIQNSSGTDVLWSNGSGQLTGSSPNGAALDIVGDATNNRPLVFASGTGTNVYGFTFPAAGGGVLRFSYLTGSKDVFQVGTDGTLFIYQAPTFQGAVTLQSTLKIQGNVGFYNATPAAKPTITGSRGGNAALASLLTGLVGLGLITDSTTA